MTNENIIMNESFRLMEQGILSGSGCMASLDDGSQVELPERIHTFTGWKAHGFTVRKGEKAIAKFPIWKYVIKQIKDADGNSTGETSERMIMKTAAFFKASQVEPLQGRA